MPRQPQKTRLLVALLCAATEGNQASDLMRTGWNGSIFPKLCIGETPVTEMNAALHKLVACLGLPCVQLGWVCEGVCRGEVGGWVRDPFPMSGHRSGKPLPTNGSGRA
jgi:hypothetical protein